MPVSHGSSGISHLPWWTVVVAACGVIIAHLRLPAAKRQIWCQFAG